MAFSCAVAPSSKKQSNGPTRQAGLAGCKRGKPSNSVVHVLAPATAILTFIPAMCLWLSTPPPLGSIKLPFTLERLVIRGDGSVDVTADFIIENTGQPGKLVDRIRLILPYPLVDTRRTKRCTTIPMAVDTFSRLYQDQISSIAVTTSDFFLSSGRANWPYQNRGLLHVRTEWDKVKGTLVLTRDGQKPDVTPTFSAYVKQGWKVVPSPDLEKDRWLWFILALRNIVCVDLVAPTGDVANHLRYGPNEQMWLRVQFVVPSHGPNAYGRLQRICRNFLEYSEVFLSPERVANDIRRSLARPPAEDLERVLKITN